MRVRGIELDYDDAGEGLPVVLLHGYPFNRSMWREQAEALSESYRVITPDLRGHGESEVAATVTMPLMAEDIAALLDELHIECAVIGGLSMGGYVALAFQQLFPARVRALVLADTKAQGDTQEAREVREQQALTALREGMEPIADAMLPKLLAPATLAEQPDTVARVREMILSTKPAGAAAAQRGMAAREDRTEMLSQIEVPTLILVGSEDAITPPALSTEMQRCIHGSRLELIKGAGHVSNLERPGEFTGALKSFLSEQ
ncbi:MAG: alpha/beta fold hydrolase [Acidobacteria bacterium]|nr:alpha/beta fold hydrolase [Acidobacteriota bacterium]